MAILRIAVRGIESEDFDQLIAPFPGTVFVARPLLLVEPNQNIVSLATKNAFLAIIRAFVDYLDTLIAIKKLGAMPQQIPVEIIDSRKLEEYLLDVVERRSQKVGADGYISNHEKARYFGELDQYLQDALEGYFELRAAFEHHKGIAKSEISLLTLVPVVSFDGNLVPDVESITLTGGRELNLQVLREHTTRVIKSGELIQLTHKELENIVWTLGNEVAPMVIALMSGQQPRWAEYSGVIQLVDLDGTVTTIPFGQTKTE